MVIMSLRLTLRLTDWFARANISSEDKEDLTIRAIGKQARGHASIRRMELSSLRIFL